jgi:precorrin-2 dehydrogenase / sirohydrochlorin ferrochelatase
MELENKYYPVFLDLEDRLCVVVGGGAVAFRKVESLLANGAIVRVVAPEISRSIMRLQGLEIRKKQYNKSDLKDALLVFAATDMEETNKAVSMDALKLNVFCNVVDTPSLCTFIVPSVVEKGPIKIAISTGGVSPALSKKLREELTVAIGNEYEILARILGRIRPIVVSQNGGTEAHKRVFETLINSSLPEAIRKSRKDEVKSILRQAIGVEVDLEGIL